ncbi:rhodanese-like domain-containing protein [Allochromatium vinosum]|uniref:Rhodanese domain protein n=1 Tax=Allochromatium vinosum (strain ATCC 17899 / DSM 180 / NBRC 103801 / NCIMB 10441 / D) TaxID=572477 RepID=D3RMG5_ALLVD|nr:rhodanese-like domain-containing protein [Allochromatium vinosum]ADC61223.1 Rhodanese domain protein [Allochromatium vinosum DSM 180]MBK1655932.1 rhodanese-like domain-containing protein [Allochromatium vinosum]
MPYQSVRRFVALIVASLVFVAGAQAGGLDLSPQEALAKAKAGEILLIDIRTPPEWRETGVAPEAHRIDMTDPKFLERLLQDMGGDKSAPIALICRTGNRSGYVQKQLQKMGFSQVHNVPEGMAGSRSGPGWIRRGLPVETCTNC